MNTKRQPTRDVFKLCEKQTRPGDRDIARSECGVLDMESKPGDYEGSFHWWMACGRKTPLSRAPSQTKAAVILDSLA
jgi:hypothetical protein